MSFTLENAPSQTGKLAIVTGANIGLGFEITLALVQKGAQVIMASRNEHKLEEAKKQILNLVPNAQLDVMTLDLGSLKSVASFAQKFIKKHKHLDLLIENAGIMVPPFSKTQDGFESQFGVNYLGHFALTSLLYKTLNNTPNSRVVTVSSLAHKQGRIDFDNLNAEKKYSKMGAYGQSKLANLMFAYEMNRRFHTSGSRVMAVSAHPGASNTNLGQHVAPWLYRLLLPLLSFVIHAPKLAALPILNAAIGKDVKGGDYYGPTGFGEMSGTPGKVESMPHSHQAEVSKMLWEESENLTGYKFNV